MLPNKVRQPSSKTMCIILIIYLKLVDTMLYPHNICCALIILLS